MPNRLKIALASASALALSVLMTSPAQAGMDGNPFEGLYAGFNANYARVTSTNSYTDLDPDGDENNFFTGIGDSNKGTGYGGSLYGGIGSNVWGPIYVGIEGSLGMAGGNATATLDTVIPAHLIDDPNSEDANDTITVPAEFGTDTLKIKAGFAFDINARLGFTVSDRVLIYGLGGYTSTKYKFSDSISDFSKSAGGYRYGAGFEVGIIEDMAIRVEYVKTSHSAISWARGADSFQFDPSGEAIRIGLILHMD